MSNLEKSELATVLSIMDRKIESMTELRARFVAEFGLSGNGTAQSTANTVAAVTRLVRRKKNKRHKKTKKELLVEFIKTNGPQPRKYLLENSGLKAGTLAGCLMDKSSFKQLEDGRWDAA